MKYDDSVVQFLLVLILFSLWTLSNDSASTVAADSMLCVEFAPQQTGSEIPSKCMKSDIGGYREISILKNANSCAFYFKDISSGAIAMSAGRTLVFIDKDNWTCDSMPDTANIFIRAALQDGELSFQSIDRDNMVAPVLHDVRSSNGLRGTIAHWYRVLNHFGTTFQNSKK
ncbi:MAG: hypothetical protein V4508_16925 [Pseudomonadota bacterium]